jgi:cytochrome c oxidase subunit 4
MTHQVVSKKAYFLVFAALLTFTATTVAVTYVDLGRLNLVIALLIAVTKASLVVYIFMDVRQSSALTKLFVGAGLFWVAVLMVLTFSDYLTRFWIYSPQRW